MKSHINFYNEKKELIDKYKTSIIESLKSSIENCNGMLIGLEESNKPKDKIEDSLNKYNTLLKKVEENEELSNFDLSLIGISLSASFSQMTSAAEQLINSAESLKQLSQAFLS